MKKLFVAMNIAGLVMVIGAAGGIAGGETPLGVGIGAAVFGLVMMGAAEIGMRNIRRIRRYVRGFSPKSEASPSKSLRKASGGKTLADA